MLAVGKTLPSKLIKIGNSKGVRLPKQIIQKYNLSENLILEQTERGVLIHARDRKKISWEDTFKAMAKEKENWDDFDAVSLDGLEDV